MTCMQTIRKASADWLRTDVGLSYVVITFQTTATSECRLIETDCPYYGLQVQNLIGGPIDNVDNVQLNSFFW